MQTEISVFVDQPYKVLIGSGVASHLVDLIPESVERIAVLHAPALTSFAVGLKRELRQAVTLIELPDAEAAKSSDVLTRCWNVLGEQGFTRSDLVVSLGGGATTDLAGFVAATWLRGCRIIHIPTTLLAMVDAAVGGKTGINTAAGKNLVGAFYHPTAVLCDLDFLDSLPLPEIQQGLAEIVKCGFISDASILELLKELDVENLNPRDPNLIAAAAKAIQVKATVVAADFTESQPGGLGREILNYGHTLGHAIEKFEKYGIRHGEAISVGMLFVAELAGLAGRLSQAGIDKHHELINHLRLPNSYASSAWPELLAAMAIDKKARGNQMRFVILNDLQSPEILTAPDAELLAEAFRRIARN